MDKFKVNFMPDNLTIEVAKDTTILAAAISGGIYINSSCGGEGVCGRCKVFLKKGRVLTRSAGHLTGSEKKQGVYLACSTEVQSDIDVEIPRESRLNLEGLTEEEVAERLKNDYSGSEDVESVGPVNRDYFPRLTFTRKFYIEPTPPNLDDKTSDLDRILRQLNKVAALKISYTSLSNIKGLGELLRSCEWKITATVAKRNGINEIINIEPQDTSRENYGIAFDIGTTTISAQLVNLNTGEILGTKATYNKQAAFGSDVITRIIYAKDSDGLDTLHHAVSDDMNLMIRDLTHEKHIDLNNVTGIICAGNTTMIHLLLRVDPTYIRREPYVPTLNFVPVMRAQEAELRINPHGLLGCVPGVASYVGGDVTAGVLSTGLYKSENVSILIDIGTNGEVVLGNREFLIAAAASAGPAFEGSGVACGMRASGGAIQRVKISSDFDVSYETIGKVKPLGICGSGYIDLIAELLNAGIIDKNGKIKDLNHKRIRKGNQGVEFIVEFKESTGTGTDIVINEADIDNLKRAKGAIYSAVSILIKHMGFNIEQIDKIFIAGGFGTYLDMNNAIRIGLLPDLDRSRFIFVGNSSLAGARQIILSADAQNIADEIAQKTTYFELSVEPGYMDEYMASLFFPHTDLSLFPSIKL